MRKAVAISAPLDLAAAGRSLDAGLSREIYTRIFLRTLKKKTFDKIEPASRSPSMPRRLRRARTFWEFDDTVTAPLHGFLGADDYWARSSSGPWLATHPRADAGAQRAQRSVHAGRRRWTRSRGAPPNVMLEFPRSGGHAGFPGRNRWLARRVLEFLSAP